jgi:hypothetical protein
MAAEPQPDNPLDDQTALLHATERSLQLYRARLSAQLEPSQNGKVVAIDAESGDYAVAKTAAEARRELLGRHPDALVITRTIGPETRQDLARRLSTTQRVRA